MYTYAKFRWICISDGSSDTEIKTCVFSTPRQVLSRFLRTDITLVSYSGSLRHVPNLSDFWQPMMWFFSCTSQNIKGTPTEARSFVVEFNQRSNKPSWLQFLSLPCCACLCAAASMRTHRDCRRSTQVRYIFNLWFPVFHEWDSFVGQVEPRYKWQITTLPFQMAKATDLSNS